MADPPPPFSIDTVLETVKKTTETIANFVQWIARLIRERKWSELVLLALTDLGRQVRAGMLTVEELQTKLKDTVKPEDAAEATTWLARGEVRLISPTEREGVIGYELPHERIIPALMQFSLSL